MPPDVRRDLQPDIETVAEQVFAALADPRRRAILAALASGGPATATDLAARLPITRQAIAKHLATLARARLVHARRVGRETRYSFDAAPLEDAARWIERIGADWDERLEALERVVEARSATGRSAKLG